MGFQVLAVESFDWIQVIHEGQSSSLSLQQMWTVPRVPALHSSLIMAGFRSPPYPAHSHGYFCNAPFCIPQNDFLPLSLRILGWS